ncbi:MAG TPA: cell division protein FtsH, partial [Syntrophales bacterium]|nr:cell division protein FtsH [Syntrophales bacterium]
VPGTGSKDYSEETARAIDEEVRTIIKEAYDKALSILRGRIDKLKTIASVLLEKEVIEGEELKKLLV